MTKVLFTTRLH